MIEAGELDRRITFQRATSAPQDSTGQPIPVWGDVATVWAKVEPVTVREPFEGDQKVAWADTKFITWYRSDVAVSPTWRISYNSRTYQIVGLKELGRREGIEILAFARAE